MKEAVSDLKREKAVGIGLEDLELHSRKNVEVEPHPFGYMGHVRGVGPKYLVQVPGEP